MGQRTMLSGKTVIDCVSVSPSGDNVTVIRNPGQPDMEIVIKDGEKIDRYQASGRIGQGEGSKAGVAYRLKDGSMVYVPEPAR